MEDLTGKQLGPYQITAALGEGGMAAVYKAYQPAMDRYVALKILPRHFASDPNFIARFRQEAKVLAKLQHPHILPVFDYGEADGYTYIVMPYIQSGTLAARLGSGPLPFGQVSALITQIGDALDYAHSQGLIHRDVKPSNVLIDERGNCLLTDFGLAKIIEGSVKLTTTGGIMGTPTYMSPEQGLGQKLDRHSDIYSLGVILYEMITGRPPYNAETPMAVVVKHINDPLPPPRTVNPATPESIERVVLKAMAKNPVDRYDTAAEMVKALQAAVGQVELTAPPTVAAQPVTIQPKAEKPARPARAPSTRPLWQLAALAGIGWDLGIVVSLPFLNAAPFIGGLIAGALGGLSLGLVWQRMEPALPWKRIWTLIGIWAVAGALVGVTLRGGALGLLFLALGGLATGVAFRRAEPKVTWKQVWLVAGSWLLGWLAGAVIIGLFASGDSGLFRALAVIVGFTLASAVGSGVTLGQWKRAREGVPPTVARPARKLPTWALVAGGVLVVLCLGAFVVLGGKAAADRAATQTAAFVGGRATNTSLPIATKPKPTPTRPAPTATRPKPTLTPVPPTATKPKPTRTAVPPTPVPAGTEANNWRVNFNYAFPSGFWSVGAHQYTMVAACPSFPEWSNTWTFNFEVSDSAAVLDGNAYFRFSGLRYAGQLVSAINPSQSTMAQWSQAGLTRSEAEQVAAGCQVTFSWDGGAPATLSATAPYQE